MPGTSSFTTRPQLAGTFGMVASTHWLASAAGMAVLEKGGNAFDAAVAAGLVLQVVEPHLNGPGGEVPVIGFDAAAGEVFVLDGQGAGARGGDAGRVRRARAGPGARHRPARGVRSGGLRDVDAAARAARQAAAARRDGVRDRLRRGRVPDAGRGERGGGRGRRHLPRALAQLGRGLPARRDGPAPGERFTQPGPGRRLHPDPGRGGGRVSGPRGADRGGAGGVLRGVRGRGDRRLPGAGRGDGRDRAAPPGPAGRGGPGRLAGVGGGPGHCWTSAA